MADEFDTIATFSVNVRQNQNASLQGQVEWFEGGKRTGFRSAWELLKLMGEVIDEEQTDWK